MVRGHKGRILLEHERLAVNEGVQRPSTRKVDAVGAGTAHLAHAGVGLDVYCKVVETRPLRIDAPRRAKSESRQHRDTEHRGRHP
jgi:hypothetical protein